MHRIDMYMGDIVRDKVTGLEGRVTAATLNIHGDMQVMIEAMDSTGRPMEWWVREERIVLVEKGSIEI